MLYMKIRTEKILKSVIIILAVFVTHCSFLLAREVVYRLCPYNLYSLENMIEHVECQRYVYVNSCFRNWLDVDEQAPSWYKETYAVARYYDASFRYYMNRGTKWEEKNRMEMEEAKEDMGEISFVADDIDQEFMRFQ